MRKNKNIKYIAFTLMAFFSNAMIMFAANGDNEYLQCGSYSIPAPLATISRVVVLILQIVLPLVLIIMGSIDILKAVMAHDGDAITKARKKFISRILTGVLFFLVIVFIKWTAGLAADSSEAGNVTKCVDCMISDEGSCGSISSNNPFLNPNP